MVGKHILGHNAKMGSKVGALLDTMTHSVIHSKFRSVFVLNGISC